MEFREEFDLFLEDVEEENMDAIYILGNYFRTGKYVEKDDRKAAELYAKASAKGHTLSQYNL